MQEPPRSAYLLVNRLMSCPDGLDRLKNDPEKTLREFAHAATEELIPPVLKREAGIFYIIVISLGFVAVAAVLGAIYLTAKATANVTVPIPDVITALGSAAIGALAGILAPSPKEK